MSASLFTSSKYSATDAAGLPLAGGQVFTYRAGTLTPAETYTNQSGTTPNTNPVILDGSGRASIWLGPYAYRIIVKDANGVLMPDGDQDNITAPLATIQLTNPVTDLMTGDGTTTPLALTQNPGSIDNIGWVLGGVPQTPGVDFTLSGQMVTPTSPTPAGVSGFLNYRVALPVGTTTSNLVNIPASAQFVARSAQSKFLETISPEDFGAIGDGTTDDKAKLQVALDYCLAQGIKELRSRRTFAVSGSLDLSNFAAGFRLSLGGLVAHSSFPTPSNWQSATPLLRVGFTGGSQVGLNVDICNVDGGNKADVIFITNNGCGGSRFHLDRVQNANIIVKLKGNTTPTASNYFSGSYWYASKCAGYVLGGTSICEGTTFDVNFISGCIYGGLIFGNGSQYANVRGQLDFNGTWVSEMGVASLAGFAIGDALNNGSGATAELLAAYTYQGNNFFLVIETKNVANGLTNFSVGNNFTNGVAVTAITGINTCNQGGNARYYDIVSALTPSQPFWRALILCPYLGGIVGSNLWNCTVDFGNSNSSFSTWIAGLQIYNSGTTLSLTDKRSSDASFLDVTDTLFAPKRAVFLNANPIYGVPTSVSAPNTSVVPTFVFAAGAATTGSVWNVVAMDSTAGIFGKCTVRYPAGSTTGVLLVEGTPVNLTFTLTSGTTLNVSQGTGATRTIYLTATRVI